MIIEIAGTGHQKLATNFVGFHGDFVLTSDGYQGSRGGGISWVMFGVCNKIMRDSMGRLK